MSRKSDLAKRLFEEDGPVIVSGRTAKTVKVGDATLLASAVTTDPLTLTTGTHTIRLCFGPDGTVIEKHVRRIRPSRETRAPDTMQLRDSDPQREG